MKNLICFDLFSRGFVPKVDIEGTVSENLFVYKKGSICNFTEVTVCECSPEKVVIVIHSEYYDGETDREETKFYKMRPEEMKDFFDEHYIK